MVLPTNVSDGDASATLHAGLHNDVNAEVNDLFDTVAALSESLDGLEAVSVTEEPPVVDVQTPLDGDGTETVSYTASVVSSETVTAVTT